MNELWIAEAGQNRKYCNFYAKARAFSNRTWWTVGL